MVLIIYTVKEPKNGMNTGSLVRPVTGNIINKKIILFFKIIKYLTHTRRDEKVLKKLTVVYI